MRLSILIALATASLAFCGDASTSVVMERLMNLKTTSYEKLRKDGFMDSGKYKSFHTPQKCVGGKAGEYSCENVDLFAFLSHEDTGSAERQGNDIWGAY